MADALQGFPATKTYKEIKKVTASERSRGICSFPCLVTDDSGVRAFVLTVALSLG